MSTTFVSQAEQEKLRQQQQEQLQRAQQESTSKLVEMENALKDKAAREAEFEKEKERILLQAEEDKVSKMTFLKQSLLFRTSTSFRILFFCAHNVNFAAEIG